MNVEEGTARIKRVLYVFYRMTAMFFFTLGWLEIFISVYLFACFLYAPLLMGWGDALERFKEHIGNYNPDVLTGAAYAFFTGCLTLVLTKVVTYIVNGFMTDTKKAPSISG